jgi:hypothetical protein
VLFDLVVLQFPVSEVLLGSLESAGSAWSRSAIVGCRKPRAKAGRDASTSLAALLIASIQTLVSFVDHRALASSRIFGFAQSTTPGGEG